MKDAALPGRWVEPDTGGAQPPSDWMSHTTKKQKRPESPEVGPNHTMGNLAATTTPSASICLAAPMPVPVLPVSFLLLRPRPAPTPQARLQCPRPRGHVQHGAVQDPGRHQQGWHQALRGGHAGGR